VLEPIVGLPLAEIEVAVAVPDGAGDDDEEGEAEPEGEGIRADGTIEAGDERDGDAEERDAEEADAAVVEFDGTREEPFQHTGIGFGRENFRVGQIRGG
jgi:hypothetical protein